MRLLYDVAFVPEKTCFCRLAGQVHKGYTLKSVVGRRQKRQTTVAEIHFQAEPLDSLWVQSSWSAIQEFYY